MNGAETVAVRSRIKPLLFPLKYLLSRNVGYVLAYSLLIAYAIYVRFQMNPDIGPGLLANLPDPDNARFFRSIELIARDYPSLPLIDSYVNYPWGMKVQLPPVWAFIEATIAVVISRLAQLSLIQAAALVPVIAGVLMAVPVFTVTKKLFGTRIAHMSAILCLMSPLTVINSTYGMVDHHIADMLLLSVLMLVISTAYESHNRGRPMRTLLFSASAGLVLVLLLLISVSAILAAAFSAAAFLLAGILLSRNERSAALLIGTLTNATAGLTLSVLYWLTPWFKRDFSFSGLSLLQPTIFLLATLMLMGLYRIVMRPRQEIMRAILSYIVMLSMAIIVIWKIAPEFTDQLIRGFYRSMAMYPLGRITTQLTPLFSGGLEYSSLIFSGVAFLIPIAYIYLILDLRSEQGRRFDRVFFLIWSISAAAYAIAVQYYLFLFVPFGIIALAQVIGDPKTVFRMVFRLKRDGTHTSDHIYKAFTATVLIASAVFWLSPRGWPAQDKSYLEMLDWIKTNTPSAGDFYDAKTKPAYGILTDWSGAEIIQLYTHRPVMANGNQETGLEGIITSYKIFQSHEEIVAAKMMKHDGLKYALLKNSSPLGFQGVAWHGDIDLVGTSGPEVLRDVYPLKKEEITVSEYRSLFHVRLYKDWGAGDLPMERLRLIKATGTDSKAPLVLFELVEGAKLTVTAKPGESTRVSAIITTEGKQFTWSLSRRADRNGHAEFTLPYANDDVYPVTSRPYSIKTSRRAVSLDVTEDQVECGAQIRLDMNE